MPATLQVFWNDRVVGELAQDGRAGLSFRYANDYLSLSEALPLSRLLPLQQGAFADDAARAFFENLLPEGGVRRQVARRFGISAENVFALLERIGGDCAGAVSLLPPGESPGPSGRYRPISQEVLSRELASLATHPLLAGEEGVRLSLAGAQDKLPLYVENGDFFIPEENSPSSHILKPAIKHLENTVVNEAFCMSLAQRIGLPVPAAEVIDIAGEQVYLVERYDRARLPSGAVERLHQEDFCQALGVLPEMKYEQEGGPGFAQCFKLVAEWSTEPMLDAVNLLRWALFNFIIGNADAHAKNVSFLYRAGAIRLAPFYDLLSTAVYPRLYNKFAMKMGGQKDPRYLMPKDLSAFATDAGVGLRAVKARLWDICDKVSAEAGPLSEIFINSTPNAAIVREIVQIAENRVRKARSLIS